MAVNVTQVQRSAQTKEKDPLESLGQAVQIGSSIYGMTKASPQKETMEDAVGAADKAMGPGPDSAMTRRQKEIDYMSGKRWG